MCTSFHRRRIQAVGDRLDTRAKGPEQPAAEGIVGVDHSGFQRLHREQARLGLTIGFHGAVVVEVVATEIGEHRHVEIHTAHAVLVKGVGGDLHRHVGGAGSEKIREHRLQLDGVGRRVGGRLQGAGEAVSEGPHQGTASPVFQCLGEEMRATGLAVGAGDARHHHLFRRPPVEPGSQSAGDTFKTVHGDQGHPDAPRQLPDPPGRPVAAGTGENRAGTGSHRVLDERKAVPAARTGAGKKDVPCLNAATVQRQAGHRQQGRGRTWIGDTLEQMRQRHRRGLCATGHHRSPPATARRISETMPGSSGGTLSSRRAWVRISENTGPATEPP